MIGEGTKVVEAPQEPEHGPAQDTAMQCEYCRSPLTMGQQVFFVALAKVWREEIHLMEPIGAFCSVDCVCQIEFEPARESPAAVAGNTSP